MSNGTSLTKNFLFLSGLLVLLVSANIELFAQGTNRPPVARTTYTYSSTNGGFNIDFPSKPLVQTIEKETSFGKNPITTCVLQTGFADYSVTFLDFPTLMTDKYDLNVRFDMMRDSQAKRLSARVTRDEEWLFGTYYGRINVFESDTVTMSVRSLIVGPRLFVLLVTTKGRLSAQSESLRKSNQDRIDKFFNSFTITHVAEPQQSVVELPADFQTSLQGRDFSSGFFDIKLVIPENWILLSQEKSDFILDLGKDQLKRKDPQLAEHTTNQNARVVATFAKTDPEKGISESYLMVLAEKAPYPNFLASAVARTYSQLYVDKADTITVPVTTTEIGGIEFAWLDTIKSDSKLYSRLYIANRKGISFEVLLMYKDPADLRAMLSSLQSLTFLSKQKQQ